jgi:hypothetical protein
MPSVEDVMHAIDDLNARLGGDPRNPADNVNSHLATLERVAAQIHEAVKTGFAELIAIGNYANEALFHLSEQNETIICNLEKITSQTCRLLNEAHEQTRLQTSIEHGIARLADVFLTVNTGAALDLERREELKREVEKWSPTKPEPPVCVYERCEKPKRINQPPKVGEEPPK